MTYYLSYVEVNKHAALMLSEQEHSWMPTRILCEIGFAPSLDIPINEIGYFSTHKGHVREETNASRALYSKTSEVTHRSYEISQAEMEKLFIILNRDRKINVSGLRLDKKSKQITYVGGPDYQKIAHNCKTYLMGILKEIGIIDAQNLSNFLIQRTGTKRSLLKPISKDELSCPLKESLIEDISTVLTQLNADMSSVLNSITDKEENVELIELIKSFLNISSNLMDNKSKVGIMLSLNKQFEKLLTLIDSIAIHTQIPGVENYKVQLMDIIAMADKISQLSNLGKLDFYWKSAPSLAPRLKLNQFNEEESTILITKVKTNELIDGIEQILAEFNNEMSRAKSFERNLFLDLKQLKHILELSKKRVGDIKSSFIHAIENKNKIDTLNICKKQQKAVVKVIDNLERKLSGFVPTSRNTSALLRFINRIIKYFRKDFITIENTQTKLLSKLSFINRSNKTLHKKLKDAKNKKLKNDNDESSNINHEK